MEYYLFKVVFLDNEEDAYEYQQLTKASRYYRVQDLKVMLNILKTDYKYVDVIEVKRVDTVEFKNITALKQLL